MNFVFTPDEDAFRKEVCDFVKSELPPGFQAGVGGHVETDEQWAVARGVTKKLAERGWLSMAWPKEYGGQDAHMKTVILMEEMNYWEAPGHDIAGVSMLAPALMAHGTEEQKRRYLPDIASGDIVWCQGWSEPGAGSDLPSLITRAVDAGDHFVVNGQKVWTSHGDRADWCFLLVKTDPEAEPKYRGISFLLLDIKSPGITIRPLLTSAGMHSFCEVFYDDVKVPKGQLVGALNQGWKVAMTAAGFERSGIYRLALALRNLDRLIELAKKPGVDGRVPAKDPWVRQQLAELYVDGQIARMHAYRVAWLQASGKYPEWEASMARLTGCEFQQNVGHFGTRMLGLYGQLLEDSKWANPDYKAALHSLLGIGATIAAGTSEIQRNTIAIRGLGLPR